MQDAINILKSRVTGEQESTSIKFHRVGHTGQFIRDFGHTSSYSSEPFESQHKVAVTRHKGNLNHAKEVNLVLLLRELVANHHRTERYEGWVPGSDWQKTKKDGHLKGLIGDCDDDTIFSILGRLFSTAHLHIQLFKKIWHASSNCYISQDVNISYVTNNGRQKYGKVTKVGRASCDEMSVSFVVVLMYKPSVDTSELSKYCQRMKLHIRKDLIIVQDDHNPINSPVYLPPDFQSLGHYFLSPWLL
jgi:hypothetical protein